MVDKPFVSEYDILFRHGNKVSIASHLDRKHIRSRKYCSRLPATISFRCSDLCTQILRLCILMNSSLLHREIHAAVISELATGTGQAGHDEFDVMDKPLRFYQDEVIDEMYLLPFIVNGTEIIALIVLHAQHSTYFS